MKYKTTVSDDRDAFNKDTLERELDSIIEQYRQEYGEEPKLVIADSISIWTFIELGIGHGGDQRYKGMRYKAAIMDKAQLLVTNEDDGKEICILMEDSRL